MNKRVYLDWNATAPLRDEARAAMKAAMDVVGNPSSVHLEGRQALNLVARARDQIAVAIGCKPGEVIFTSGATEAAGILRTVPPDHPVFVEETAHDALWAHNSAGGDGAATLAYGTANSETGVIHAPERDDDGWIWGGRRASWLLLDITQMVGRAPFSFTWSGADMAVLSAHKLGGPKGVGALILRDGVDIEPLALGGGQELGRRSGTENVIGIAGFGAAIEAAMTALEAGVWNRVAELRNILESRLEARSPKTIFVGQDKDRLPNTSCFATPDWKGETQVMTMDLAGYAISSGSACSSGKVKSSRVLKAMGYPADVAASAIRVSLGPTTTEDDVIGFAEAWGAASDRHKARAA